MPRGHTKTWPHRPLSFVCFIKLKLLLSIYKKVKLKLSQFYEWSFAEPGVYKRAEIKKILLLIQTKIL